MTAQAHNERDARSEHIPLRIDRNGRRITITLDDPSRRNALGRRMFTALEDGIAELERGETSPLAGGADAASARGHADAPVAPPSMPAAAPTLLPILRIRGNGPAFCAGFDLDACAGDDGQTTLAEFIVRLSAILRRLRRGAWIAVAEVHGAALAGGCAIAAACDFVVCAHDALLGYPVHRIGVSPAVNAPLVQAAMGAGAARSLLLSGELINGIEAVQRRLAWRSEASDALAASVDDLVDRLLAKGPVALRATKRWLNELDGSDRDDRLDGARAASLELCGGDESVRMIASFRAARRGTEGE